MTRHGEPLVSVVTPVYNGEAFLAECIESVLRQSFENFEYVIVNNHSTDRSLEIASTYARRDSRIRIHNNATFVGVIDNHNIAFSLIAPDAAYCKVVSADDFLFPDCLRRLVDFAEGHPSVGIVGSYQLSGSCVRWQGFEYPRAVFSGRDICRRIFLGGDPSFGFGSPTSILYRADLMRKTPKFYPNASPHADTSACFENLQNWEFGFVYQVLSYEQTHGDTQSSTSALMNRYASAYLNDLIRYGPLYLSGAELRRRLKEELNDYHRFLAFSLLRHHGETFWTYHKSRLNELGYRISPSLLLKTASIRILREILNPEQALRKAWRSIFPASSKSWASISR
jgi:glycosyltransferase involved in cell wall biosynthesis